MNLLKNKGSSDYSTCQKTLHQRDAKAFQIVQELSRYELAIDIHGIDISRLKEQAERHTCYQQVT